MKQRLLPFLLITFIFSWSIAWLMHATDISYGSFPSIVLTGMYFMWGPAIAAIYMQSFRLKRPAAEIGWQFDKKRNKWLFLLPLFFTGIFILFMLINFFAGNIMGIEGFGALDFTSEGFDNRFPAAGEGLDLGPWTLVVLGYVFAILIGSFINLPFMFGEEFGWRGYLLKNTEHLGFMKTNLLIGTIWGFWHLPLILMGHNYPDNPYSGIMMMVLACIAFTPLFTYIMHKSGSILLPCLLHAFINGTAGIITLVHDGGNPMYYSIAGLAGVIAFTAANVCIMVFDKEYVRGFNSKAPHII
jgi:uncharacterized protein